ncbi:response regulator [Horticoccus luteus]|uniref:Response regulator n=1 Tax=Horticoccus luteus TaxID=2862869 RepID=A0A8F9XLN4_9BACT|nr:response regulator [Horticoccus luteus]QYM79209.1 response regulator [Horticoccus luteus]
MARILLVDDSDELRGNLALSLQQLGHTIIELPSGLNVDTVCENNSVDLVILDMVMPNVEGTEVLAALKRDRPSLPIIAMSGSVNASTYLRMAEGIGANYTLSKPFSLTELVAAIHDATGRPQANSKAP